MPKLDYSNMSLEELTEAKSAIKRQVNALHEEARELGAVQAKLIEEEHVAEARRQLQILADKNGRTLQEEAEYWQGRLTENGDTGRWIQSNLVLGKPGKVELR